MMRRGWRLWIALAAFAPALSSPAIPAIGQSASEAPPATTNSTDPVGPPQLRGFSLEGRVTRPGGEQETATPPPAQRQAPPSAATERQPQPRAAQSQRAPSFTPSRPERGVADPSPVATGQLPPAENVEPPPTLPPADGGLAPEPFADPAYVPPPVLEPVGTSEGYSLLPWLFAGALAIVALAAFQFFRRRSRAQLAGGPDQGFGAIAAEPAPQAPVLPRAAQPAPGPLRASPVAGGVVSTRLRPWLEIGFTPDRLVLDSEKLTLEFTLELFNSGTAPAVEIAVEAGLFNAGPMQDQQIRAFFERPAGQGSGVAVVQPQQRLSVPGSVAIALAQLQPLQVEGRSLLVPLVAFNGVYRAGSATTGQTSVSYLVGKETGGDKLAPFRLDLGPRVFRGLAARQHDLRVRK